MTLTTARRQVLRRLSSWGVSARKRLKATDLGDDALYNRGVQRAQRGAAVWSRMSGGESPGLKQASTCDHPIPQVSS